jgi:hypothetical protein
MKIDQKALGMSDLVIEQPKKAQRDKFPNVLANVRLNLNLAVTAEGVPSTISLIGVKVLKTNSNDKIVVTPSWMGENSIKPFYPLGKLGEAREKYILAMYELHAAEWAKQGPLPEDMEIEITMNAETAAAEEKTSEAAPVEA